MNASATFSPDGLYRYRLTREWSNVHPSLAWIMLNPSTADAIHDDPTIRKCIKFAQRWGYGRIEVVNLFAFRATNPAELRRVAHPVGSLNDTTIGEVLDEALDVVCAWGVNNPIPERATQVMGMIHDRRIIPKALRITKDWHPGHPLYIRDDTELIPYA